MTDIDSAVQKLTPEQVAGILSGAIVVAPGVAESVRRIHGVTPPAVAVVPAVLSPADRRRENEAWLASQAVYEEARDRAEAAGGTPETLNALLAPTGRRLSGGLVLHPLTISGYVFLEAVDSPFVTGGGAPLPTDLMFLAAALTVPEEAAALLTYDDDFRPQVDRGGLADLARRIGQQVRAEDVPRVLAHATAQLGMMFPTAPTAAKAGSEEGGSGPLEGTPAAL